jgi:DNA (cytosine-5)-methyltransferase 1
LDFSLPAERIGDRARPLKPRTLERIQYGLDKYGRIALVIRTNMTTDAGRVRSIADAMHTQTASRLDALFSPPSFVVETAYHQDVAYRSRGVDEPLPPQTTQQSAALVSLPLRLGLVMPFIVSGQMNRRVYGSDDPLSTQAASRVHDGVVLPPTFFATLHGTSKAHAGDGPLGAVLAGGGHHGLVIIPQNDNAPRSGHEPLPGVSTRGGHAIIQGAALLTMRAHPELLFRTLDKALPAQVASGTQDWLLQRNPYLVSYYGTNNVSGSHEAVPTISTLDRHAVLEPTEELKVDDCYFRMLQPHEIKAAMAFPADYTVLGNKRDQVKQCGNAVTPPAEEWLIRRCVESLLPGKRRKAA